MLRTKREKIKVNQLLKKGEKNSMKKTRISSTKGFTLIELIIVITILAVLAVIGMQAYGTITAKSRAQVDVSNAQNLGTAINRAYAEGKISTFSADADNWQTNGGDIFSAISSSIPNGEPPIKAAVGYKWFYNCTQDGSSIKVGVGPSSDSSPTQVLYPKTTSAYTDSAYDFLN